MKFIATIIIAYLLLNQLFKMIARSPLLISAVAVFAALTVGFHFHSNNYEETLEYYLLKMKSALEEDEEVEQAYLLRKPPLSSGGWNYLPSVNHTELSQPMKNAL